jgi:winged helix-turn-helix protein DUF2582
VAKKKSKSTKSPKRRPPSHSSNEAPAKEVDRLIKPDKEAPRAVGEMSGIEIGHVAGDVWGVLSNHGELTLAVLKKEVAAPADMVLAAIGWLAREDKIEFSTTGRTIKVSLR